MKRKELENRMLQALQEGNDCAPLWKRFFSYVIDYFLSTILISLIPMIATSILTGEKAFTSENFTAIPMGWRILLSGVAMAVAVYYFCILTLKETHRGQTLGKRILGIRIVTVDGQELTWKHMCRRELIGSLLIEGETAFPSAYVRYFIFLWLPQALSQGLYYVYMGISFCSIVYAVFGMQHRMFHDIVGGTRVAAK